jgi:competence protein ComEA
MRFTISTALALCALIIAASPVLATQAPVPAQAQAAAQAMAAGEKAPVNLNAATVEQLATLPGIGPKVAERILEYRTKNGGFKKIEELMNVKGIGEKSFLKIKPLVSVAKPDKASGGGE